MKAIIPTNDTELEIIKIERDRATTEDEYHRFTQAYHEGDMIHLSENEAAIVQQRAQAC